MGKVHSAIASTNVRLTFVPETTTNPQEALCQKRTVIGKTRDT